MALGILVLAGATASATPARAEPRPVPAERGGRPAPAASAAAMPAVALWVEWREVAEPLHEESAGGREASVTATGSATGPATGSAPPQPGTWSTLPAPDREPAADQRVRLANGGSVRITQGEGAAVAWRTDLWLEAGAGARPRGEGAMAGAIRPSVSLRPVEAEGARTVALTARWPGGTAPVTVDLRLDDPSATDGRPQHLSGSTLVPLDRWTTVAQLTGRAGDGALGAPGTVGTRRAGPVRLLQLRVRLAAPPPQAAPAPGDSTAAGHRKPVAGTGADPRPPRAR